MLTLSPIELVLRVSAATVGAGETPPGTNAGPFVERVLGTTGNRAGDPWCAAWVAMVGRTALGDAWPVVRSASCVAIAEWAAAQQCRYVAQRVPAQVGDLFLLHYPALQRFAHVGLVIGVGADGRTITTREGNTSGAGSREGWLVAERQRVLTPQDRLVRWVDVLRAS